MKCLAIGMNPNYVLSEEERKRRFKKRNNSIKEEVFKEERNTAVPVDMKVKVNTTDFEHQEKTEADSSEFFQKQAEGAANHSYAVETISSPQNQNYLDQGMKHYRNPYQQKINDFEQNFRGQRELAYFKPPCSPLEADNNQIRGTIIMRNEKKFSNTEFSATKNAFMNRENKTSVIKEARAKIFKDGAMNTYFNSGIKPVVACIELLRFCTHQKPENFPNNGYADKRHEGMIFKEPPPPQDQIPEITSNSESEDEISLQITLSHEPEIIFTEDEKHQLDQLVSDHDKVYHSVNFGEVLIKEMLMCSMFGVSVSTSAAIQGYRLQVERITRTANSLKCFTNLQKVDQVSLLKENADLLVSLRGAIFFDKKKKGVDQLLSSMGIGLNI